MELGDGGEGLQLVVEEEDVVSSSCSYLKCQCRICHEEEEESFTGMETPCACSGSLKFAHRGCIQRWCDEKGSTTCEICLKKFEPGYSVAPRPPLVEVVVTMRQNYESENHRLPPNEDHDEEDDSVECSPISKRSTSWCRSVGVILTVILLVKEFFSVISVGEDHYAFTLLTVLFLRASGILLPFFVILRIITVIQRIQSKQQTAQFNFSS